MPKYRDIEWNGYEVSVVSKEYDIFRILPIVPYFWDSKISFDVVVKPPKGSSVNVISSLKYKWELRDLDDALVKSGQDIYNFGRLTKRKHSAIKIEYLKPQQHYRLNLILTDVYGVTSEPRLAVSFTVKDRDEVYTQIFISLIVIMMGIIIGFLVRGCPS